MFLRVSRRFAPPQGFYAFMQIFTYFKLCKLMFCTYAIFWICGLQEHWSAPGSCRGKTQTHNGNITRFLAFQSAFLRFFCFVSLSVCSNKDSLQPPLLTTSELGRVCARMMQILQMSMIQILVKLIWDFQFNWPLVINCEFKSSGSEYFFFRN